MHGEMQLAKTSRRKPFVLDDALAQVLTGAAPEIAGAEQVGTIEVIDPDELKSDPATMRRRVKVVALRDDPVGRMARRGQLGPLLEPAKPGREGAGGSRLKAAREYQRLYEMAEIGGARAIDTTREAVDGGRFAMPDTDSRLKAQGKLSIIDRKLGERGVGLVRLILVHKLEITEFTQGASPRERDHVGRSFRDHLTTMAMEFGLISRTTARHDTIDQHIDLASYAHDPAVHRMVHKAKRRS